ncbi:MAG: GspH/FimT family pseudopilin [Planctomycetes bacterium]|nr:GspH/FimT family pseudopilin [Planctomycetota bacterium]
MDEPRAIRKGRARRALGTGLKAGFSLVEMLAVLVILGLIAGIVMVSWRAILPHEQLHSAVRALAGSLQSARSEAIARNGEYRIQYDLENARYRLVTPFKPGGGLAAREEDKLAFPWTVFPKGISFHHVVIDGVEYSKGVVFVRFDSLGSASGHTITLAQKPDDAYFTVDVQSLTGLIEYHEGIFVREPAREGDFQ